MRAPYAEKAMNTDATRRTQYAERLQTLESAWWKRLFSVQAPYRWNIRRLSPGFTLDIGCGLGRNLLHLDGHGVGIDHNPESVAVARARGLVAFTDEAFATSEWNQPGRFDSLLLAHVVEHMRFEEALALLQRYLPLCRQDGRVILIAPQEAGFQSDPTHIEFFDFDRLDALLAAAGLRAQQRYSFPFPRGAGGLFKYNEFVVTAERQAA